MDYDWTKFEIVFYYNQPIDELFRCWVTGIGLESFFIEKALFESAVGISRTATETVEKGDQYRWEWRHAFAVEGKVLNIKHNEEFAFSFGDMKVFIYFSSAGNQTKLHLVQSEIPNTAHGQVMGHLNCRSCWVFFLTNLKSVLETGRDLRDADPARASSMEVGFI